MSHAKSESLLLEIYDAATDSKRPATQADIDRLQAQASAYVYVWRAFQKAEAMFRLPEYREAVLAAWGAANATTIATQRRNGG